MVLSVYFRLLSLNVSSSIYRHSFIDHSIIIKFMVNCVLLSFLYDYALFCISFCFSLLTVVPLLTFLPIMSVCFVHKLLSIYWNLLSHKREPLLAIKLGSIHYFLYKEVPVPIQVYVNCFPCV